MKPQLTLLVGVPLSGKTTFANNFIKENKKTVIVSRDIERLSLLNSLVTTSDDEQTISNIVKDKINRLIQSRYNIIVDDTNLSHKTIDWFITNYNHSADINIIKLPLLDLGGYIQRNQKRFDETNKLISLDSIKKFIKRYNELDLSKYGEFIDNKITIKAKNRDTEFVYDNNKENCFIFDLDGTLSYSPQRDFYGINKEFILKDKVVEPVKKVLNSLVNSNNNVIFVSGRGEIYREETITWLKDNVVENKNYDIVLYMRKEKDYRSDVVIKSNIYNKVIEPNYNVIGVFDDRNSVCEFWINKGVFLFDVSQFKGYF